PQRVAWLDDVGLRRRGRGRGRRRRTVETQTLADGQAVRVRDLVQPEQRADGQPEAAPNPEQRVAGRHHILVLLRRRRVRTRYDVVLHPETPRVRRAEREVRRAREVERLREGPAIVDADGDTPAVGWIR